MKCIINMKKPESSSNKLFLKPAGDKIKVSCSEKLKKPLSKCIIY